MTAGRFAILPAHVVAAWSMLTASEAKVIVPIAARMNRNGEAWPGRETIMSEAGISNTHTFAKAIDGLGKKGILKITHRPNKSHLYVWPDVLRTDTSTILDMPLDSTSGCATSPHNQTSGCATSRPLDVLSVSTRSIEENITKETTTTSETESEKTEGQSLPEKLEKKSFILYGGRICDSFCLFPASLFLLRHLDAGSLRAPIFQFRNLEQLDSMDSEI